jgi:hypothetical protein
MKTATALIVMAAGAVSAFAVDVQVSFQYARPAARFRHGPGV